MSFQCETHIKNLYKCDKIYDLYFIAKRDLSRVYSDYVNAPYFPYGETRGWRECKHYIIKSLDELKLVPMIAVPKYKVEGKEEYERHIHPNNYHVVNVKSENDIKTLVKEDKYVSFYELKKHKPEVVVEKGNVALYEVDAVVNAANSSLFPGSGVCGAIFSNAGYNELYDECMKIGGCKTGESVITNGYNLKAPHIIHTVGPIYENDELYDACYDVAVVQQLCKWFVLLLPLVEPHHNRTDNRYSFHFER